MNVFRLALTAAIFITAPTVVIAHSGGLNSSGCHAGSKPYHCHRSQSPTRTPEKNNERESSTGSGCNSNYSGCVPNASDVDCAGGSGNGPEYVSGPIEVIGVDIYGLDRDGDGIACEKD